MKQIEVEVLSEATNNAVIRLPGRAFPGVVVQGDSLKILHDLAQELYESAKNARSEEVTDLACELAELLAGRLQHYEVTLDAHHIKPPY